ncbi:uncharacterized protein BCR38DRAFT_450356 [Pseudomassariella vexata]|uniref:SnoaL-like domain-containing protein n=1 Tax=Pseudomassariella vexata TaxID=1141098 RepID=A0A1Y2DCD3_9PEZI|nr:uncharacterized protein BCR38DRAFT_450356 [Pseudomassariella vexata]ORY56918.1 hypothetical protein BCR38DRAFT_450356 [Pseudomassariella vexata]
MHFLTFLAVLSAPLAALAAPTVGTPVRALPPSRILDSRAEAVVTPPPCVAISPAPSVNETQARSEAFANAFLVKKNLTEAFTYIAASYRNHNPFASGDGPGPALDVLGPVWPTVQITVLRTKFQSPQSWLNYRVSGMGEIVDRYRWEAGCIVEHWDQGEQFPA